MCNIMCFKETRVNRLDKLQFGIEVLSVQSSVDFSIFRDESGMRSFFIRMSILGWQRFGDVHAENHDAKDE